jgi:hypothetical protein
MEFGWTPERHDLRSSTRRLLSTADHREAAPALRERRTPPPTGS